MKRFEKHIFICENKRPEGHLRGCCAEKNSPEIKELLKKKLKSLDLMQALEQTLQVVQMLVNMALPWLFIQNKSGMVK